jgi:glycosyltransferase involved in cell wall biosynthesis
VLRRAHEFDVLHFHLDYMPFSLFSRQPVPHVTTLHGRLDLPEIWPHYRTHTDVPLISISDSQRKPMAWANWAQTIHHGLPENLLRHDATVQPDYLAFIGRISPEKRVDRAIDIALACGVPLRIAAKVDEVDRDYFASRIRPLLDHPLVEFIGEIDEPAKNDFIGNARALLFPIDWPEPFGIVMIEAFACGTPVISYPGGSVAEVMQHGVTGFVVSDQQEAIEAAEAVQRIDRRRCRQVFEERFTSHIMARRYLDVYRDLRKDER